MTALHSTPAVIQAADLIYEAAGRYFKSGAGSPKHGYYESNVEANILFVQVIRHIEAITELAKRDLVMLPSALVLARAAFETTVRILWMLRPDEVFDREARFLAHLAGEEEYYLGSAKLLAQFNQDTSAWRAVSDKIHSFRTGVEKLLPPHIQRIKRLPHFQAMLSDVGDEKRYANYKRLSQFSHGSHAAGELYRKNLGSGKQIGEFIYPESWAEPLECAWWCFAKGGSTILTRLGESTEKLFDQAFFDEVTEALNKV